MRIVICNGSRVLSERELGSPGPEVLLDPWNQPERITIRRRDKYGQISESIDLTDFADMGEN